MFSHPFPLKAEIWTSGGCNPVFRGAMLNDRKSRTVPTVGISVVFNGYKLSPFVLLVSFFFFSFSFFLHTAKSAARLFG